MRSKHTPRVRSLAAVAVLLTTFFAPQAFAADQAEDGPPAVALVERIDPDQTGPAPSAVGLQFGYSVSAADLDGDGDDEILTCRCASDGGVVEILGMGDKPIVIGEGLGGFTGDLDRYDWFGDSVEAIGDLDGDGNVDLAVGAPFDDDGSFNRGAVWILFLDGDGAVASHAKVSSTEGGIAPLVNNARLGTGIAAIGDIDGDGIGDLAVGAANDPVNGVESGTVRIWLMNTDGTVKGESTISQLDVAPNEPISREFFGVDVAATGDVNNDGVPDVAIAASWDNSFGSRSGAVFVVSLDATGTAIEAVKVPSEVAGAELGAGLTSVREDETIVGLIASQQGTEPPSVAYLDLEVMDDGAPGAFEHLTHPDLVAYTDAAFGSGVAIALDATGARSIIAGAPLADGVRADDGALVVLHLDGAATADPTPDQDDCLPPVEPVAPGPEPIGPEEPSADPTSPADPTDPAEPVDPPIDPVEPSEPPAPVEPPAEPSVPNEPPAPIETLPPAPAETIPGIPVVAFADDCDPAAPSVSVPIDDVVDEAPAAEEPEPPATEEPPAADTPDATPAPEPTPAPAPAPEPAAPGEADAGEDETPPEPAPVEDEPVATPDPGIIEIPASENEAPPPGSVEAQQPTAGDEPQIS